MKLNGDPELEDVPQLLKKGGVVSLLLARAALSDAAEETLKTALAQGRGMTVAECARVDEYVAQARDITRRLTDRERPLIRESITGQRMVG
jgi:hypothetical protein